MEPPPENEPAPKPRLVVCTSCRASRPLAEDEIPPGRLLHDALAEALAAHPAPPVELHAVTCLAACERGCTAAITAPGKWTYLLGHLTPALAGDLLAYGATYAAHASGAVLPSRRPDSLRKVVLGRLPALQPPVKDSAA
ncbi:DUF1636 domain-containing protein [Roseomonas sp. E05]|uniref:DUF1636 domain-containing protein n=1 Tax=Roseomonas sp. E05 TaxID=3046310 RepID=UPI0024B99AF4|nr:DUF1636 domain-containing protein [Roseomonas sp. E05]MDJ0388985.1 DUF1636 domain-containing protein [Roseomonas sp. E05]